MWNTKVAQVGIALNNCSESFRFEQQNLYDCLCHYVPDFMYVFMPVCLYVCLSQTMVAVWVKTMECQFYICMFSF